jgi:hypothetical protein
MLCIYGCGNQPEGTGIAKGNEEIAIYTAILRHHESLGMGRVQGIYHETNITFLEGSTRPDCPESKLLKNQMPEINEDLISMFCINTATAHSISPELVNTLSLAIIQPHDAHVSEFFHVSSIQVDTTHRQALVFVEVRKGDTRRGAYLLLQRENDTWTVLYDIQMYIS